MILVESAATMVVVRPGRSTDSLNAVGSIISVLTAPVNLKAVYLVEKDRDKMVSG